MTDTAMGIPVEEIVGGIVATTMTMMETGADCDPRQHYLLMHTL